MDPIEAGVPSPSICRMVIFRETTGEDVPAVVTAVLDGGNVSLTAFPPGRAPQPIHDVPLNDPATGDIAPDTWRWPVRS